MNRFTNISTPIIVSLNDGSFEYFQGKRLGFFNMPASKGYDVYLPICIGAMIARGCESAPFHWAHIDLRRSNAIDDNLALNTFNSMRQYMLELLAPLEWVKEFDITSLEFNSSYNPLTNLHCALLPREGRKPNLSLSGRIYLTR